ncbi:MAG: sigma-54-dependent Fis family transcriptional regulator [Pirellulales bacterium]|nr:sigma-54-dependent Fis family transcriptional regulator [Pirellulales bacterium]
MPLPTLVGLSSINRLMARQRIRIAELARLFNAVDRPVYVLDDELVIRFCNESCMDWIGPTIEKLVGRRCVYHTSPASDEPTRVETIAEGLCPSPVVLAGRVAVGTVSAAGTDGVLRRRQARFVPVGPRDEELLAIIAMVEPVDLDETDQTVTDVLDPRGLEPVEPSPDELHDCVRRFRHEAAGRYRADRLLGNSPAMRLARARIELAVASRAHVLVVGPPGSGRQHVAHAVHYTSDPRHPGTLIPVDCAVLGADLIRSTIHALAANPLGERAVQSTLLLGEADLMPTEVQADVAATISAKTFLPRVVATAAAPLERSMGSGKYHPPLAAMLSTIVIQLPALADRREDIPLLAQMFLEEANARGPKQLGGFSPEALDRLDAYSWPGNVDELGAAVAEAYREADGPEIQARDLPVRLRRAADAAAHPPREDETIQLDEFLGQIERELITRAMAQAKGNKTKAAALLGITRPRLYRRLVQLGLEEE